MQLVGQDKLELLALVNAHKVWVRRGLIRLEALLDDVLARLERSSHICFLVVRVQSSLQLTQRLLESLKLLPVRLGPLLILIQEQVKVDSLIEVKAPIVFH